MLPSDYGLLCARLLIFADASVKHATPLADRGLATETRDLTERGLVDAIIVSGDYTGAPTSPEDIAIVRQHTTCRFSSVVVRPRTICRPSTRK